MIKSPADIGRRGPERSLYNKNGLKFATKVCSAEELDSIPSCRLAEEDVVISAYPKSGDYKKNFILI